MTFTKVGSVQVCRLSLAVLGHAWDTNAPVVLFGAILVYSLHLSRGRRRKEERTFISMPEAKSPNKAAISNL